MNIDSTDTEALSKLYNYREKIEDLLAEIEALLQVYFMDEFSIAHQHWIPQIKTALRDDIKWLPRGQYSMDYTIKHLIEKALDHNKNKGVTKYII